MGWGDAPLTDTEWIPFRNEHAETVPAYGAMVFNGGYVTAGGIVCIKATRTRSPEYYGTNFCYPLLINGPSDVASGAYGRCTIASNRPTLALCTTRGSDSAGNRFGPIPDTWTLGIGLPGFRQVSWSTAGGDADEIGDSTHVVVMRDPDAFSYIPAVATTNWDDRSATFWALQADLCAYDGSTRSPQINVSVELPYYASGGHPNIVSGAELFVALIQSDGAVSGGWVCVSPYMDAAIGTVRATIKTTAPTGWAIMDGTANGAGNGGSGTDMRGYFPVGYKSGDSDFGSWLGTGGDRTHVHDSGTGTTFGTTGTDYTEDSHLPPYRSLNFIERLDNSE